MSEQTPAKKTISLDASGQTFTKSKKPAEIIALSGDQVNEIGVCCAQKLLIF